MLPTFAPAVRPISLHEEEKPKPKATSQVDSVSSRLSDLSMEPQLAAPAKGHATDALFEETKPNKEKSSRYEWVKTDAPKQNSTEPTRDFRHSSVSKATSVTDTRQDGVGRSTPFEQSSHAASKSSLAAHVDHTKTHHSGETLSSRLTKTNEADAASVLRTGLADEGSGKRRFETSSRNERPFGSRASSETPTALSTTPIRNTEMTSFKPTVTDSSKSLSSERLVSTAKSMAEKSEHTLSGSKQSVNGASSMTQSLPVSTDAVLSFSFLRGLLFIFRLDHGT